METADGTKVGRDWKVVKSEYVVWQETIVRKQHDLHDDQKLNQPGGAFTERSIQRSQQSWMKTYMEDITDSSGRTLFDNLSWFAKKLCSVMTSVSVYEHVEYHRVDTQQTQEKIVTTNCGKSCSCP